MPWIKVDDTFTDHPKVMAAGPLASWLYVCGLTYSGRMLTDGFIPESQVRKLADIDGAMAHAEKLVAVGLWQRVSGGFRIHDYHDYQPTAEKVKADRKAAQERMQRVRSGEVRANNERTNGEPAENVRAKFNDPVPTPVSPGLTPEETPGPASVSGADAPREKPKRRLKKSDLPDYTPEFEAFWAACPRQEPSKVEAFAAWLKAIEADVPPDVIMAGLERHIPAWRLKIAAGESEFVPYVTTWLNGKRWTATPARASPNPNGQRATSFSAVAPRVAAMRGEGEP